MQQAVWQEVCQAAPAVMGMVMVMGHRWLELLAVVVGVAVVV